MVGEELFNESLAVATRFAVSANDKQLLPLSGYA